VQGNIVSPKVLDDDYFQGDFKERKKKGSIEKD
jgi:hypothetical protein